MFDAGRAAFLASVVEIFEELRGNRVGYEESGEDLDLLALLACDLDSVVEVGHVRVVGGVGDDGWAVLRRGGHDGG